ncbi:hypothetical protein MRX96_052629 [Rhipicephalus microplus]
MTNFSCHKIFRQNTVSEQDRQRGTCTKEEAARALVTRDSRRQRPFLINRDLCEEQAVNVNTRCVFIADQPRRAMAAAAKKPVLVQLDIDSIDGQLASDGSMGTLISYLDMEQAVLSFIAVLCYIVLGLTLLSLFVVLPVAAFALRRHTAGVGLVQCLMCGLVLVGCCFVQLICLMSMISTWYAIKDALGEKAPEAYEWTFELLHNYTQLTVTMLKAAKDPDLNLGQEPDGGHQQH